MRFPIASKHCPMCSKVGYKRNINYNYYRCDNCQIAYSAGYIYIYMNGFCKGVTHTVYSNGILCKKGSWKLKIDIENFNTLKEALNAFIKIEIFG